MSAIELQDVAVFYGKRAALDGVTVSLPEAPIGLLGPNGAGKSTLMKTLLGFLRPARGSVRLMGLDQPDQALEIRQRLGYMPERDLMSPRVSAVSFLVYCGCLHGMTRPDAMERTHVVLNYVGLGENRYRKMETYSKGMCQRVKFAQAIIHDPDLLLLDEPTNGLDPDGRAEMLELIGQLAKKPNMTVVLSTHLLPDVQAVCKHLAIIHKGKIAREGPIEELTSMREGTFEIRVHDHHPQFAEAVARLGCTTKVLMDGTLRIATPDGLSTQALFRTAHELGTHIRHIKPVRQRLEETFMEAIGRGEDDSANGRPPALPKSDDAPQRASVEGG